VVVVVAVCVVPAMWSALGTQVVSVEQVALGIQVVPIEQVALTTTLVAAAAVDHKRVELAVLLGAVLPLVAMAVVRELS